MAGTEPRGYTSKDTAALRRDGSKVVSKEMSSADSDTIKLGVSAEKVSYQSSGNLVCSVDVSLNGTDWITAGANATAAAIVSYNTHNIVAVRATWVSGTGRLHLAAS